MVSEKRAEGYLKEHRRGAASLVLVLAAAMLAVPPVILSLTPGGWSNWVSSSIRLLALYAFTLIFVNIVTGALAPYFYVIFKPRPEYLIHLTTGVLGFLFALSHGLIVVTQRYYRGFSSLWIIGPVALFMLAVAIWAALDRTRLKRVWRSIHEINYAIFVAIFIKAVVIGTDFKLATAASYALMVVFSVYVGVAAVAVVLRLRRYQLVMAQKKAAAAAAHASASDD